MKPIDITLIQRMRLISLCENLFPESDISLNKDGILSFKKPEQQIHWFEFTVTHLWMKVFPDIEGMMFGEPTTISNSRKHYEILALWLAGYPPTYKKELINFHPIDYLFEEYKQNQS